MPKLRHLSLTTEQRRELVALRDTGQPAYKRERAAALLKVADGQRPTHVARTGLFRPRNYHTVCGWLDAYLAGGIAGLTIRTGRGRKPAFSP